jgi:hypothetical protein
MSGRSLVSVLIFLLLATGCGPSSVTAEEVTPAIPPVPTGIATDAPKQNDLLFIEFFAIT